MTTPIEYLLQHRELLLTLHGGKPKETWGILKHHLPEIESMMTFNTFRVIVSPIVESSKLLVNELQVITQQKNSVEVELQQIIQEKENIEFELQKVRQEKDRFEAELQEITQEKENIKIELQKVNQEKESNETESQKITPTSRKEFTLYAKTPNRFKS